MNFALFPHRSPVAQFLLKDGQQGMWVVGNKVVTVTTSGGGTKTGSSGLCDNCLEGLPGRGGQGQETLVVPGPSSVTSPYTGTSSSPGSRHGERRRHRSMASLSNRSQSQVAQCCPVEFSLHRQK